MVSFRGQKKLGLIQNFRPGSPFLSSAEFPPPLPQGYKSRNTVNKLAVPLPCTETFKKRFSYQ